MKFKTVEDFLIGKEAKSNYTITCLNPAECFVIVEVRVERLYEGHEYKHEVLVRGENTMWFGYNSWELV